MSAPGLAFVDDGGEALVQLGARFLVAFARLARGNARSSDLFVHPAGLAHRGFEPAIEFLAAFLAGEVEIGIPDRDRFAGFGGNGRLRQGLPESHITTIRPKIIKCHAMIILINQGCAIGLHFVGWGGLVYLKIGLRCTRGNKCCK